VKISIVIPNWNGKDLLERNLPKVTEASEQAEIIIVDDCSTDGSVEYLKKLQNSTFRRNPPKEASLKLQTIFSKENLGFVRAVNRGVKQASGEIIVLLNNDVVPQKGFLEPSLRHFEDPKVFAISFYEPNWSWSRLKWVNGFVEHEPGPKVKATHISAWASGGSAAFRKTIWEELGGFDEIYSPFYWEDIDLSYRAWKRGYQVLWEPKSIVDHQHEQTIKRFPQKYVNFISQRNQLLFIWKNITDLKMMLEHKFYLVKRLLTSPGFWQPFLAAKARCPRIFWRRFKEFREKKVSDREILEKFA